MNSFGDLSIKYIQCKSTDMTWRSIFKVMHAQSFSWYFFFLTVGILPDHRFHHIPYLRDHWCVWWPWRLGGGWVRKYQLWEIIKDQSKFQLQDISSICEGINNGFEAVHKDMESLRGNVFVSMCVGTNKIWHLKYGLIHLLTSPNPKQTQRTFQCYKLHSDQQDSLYLL